MWRSLVDSFHAVIELEEVYFVIVEEAVCELIVFSLQHVLSAAQCFELQDGPSRVLHDEVVKVFVFNLLPE